MSSGENKIKDSKLWLIPAGTLLTMVVACVVAIVLLGNTLLQGLFSQVDLGVKISQESMDTFSQKANLTIETSMSDKSFSTHKYVCEGENQHEELPVSSEEFSSFVAYTLPGDFPIHSTQVKFNDGGVEMSSKVKLADLIEMIEEEESGSSDIAPMPEMPESPDIQVWPIDPEHPENSKIPEIEYSDDIGAIVRPAGFIPTMDFVAPGEDSGNNKEDSNKEGLKRLLDLLPDNVNVYAKGYGVIVNNKITNFKVEVLNLSGFNLTDFVDEETAYEITESIINGILEILSEELKINFVYAEFTAYAMLFTGTMPQSITMVEK